MYAFVIDNYTVAVRITECTVGSSQAAEYLACGAKAEAPYGSKPFSAEDAGRSSYAIFKFGISTL